MVARFPDGIFIDGSMTLGNVTINPGLTRANMVQEQLAVFEIPWTAWRIWDAMHTNLPGTSATDDLALIGGTFATGVPSIQTSDLKAAGSTTRYARCMIQMPIEYDAASGASLQFSAGMITNPADTAATIDAELYLSAKDRLKSGSDLITTSAISINSTTFSNKSFTITSGGLSPGDILDLRLTVAVNDGATGTAVTGCVGAAFLLCDVKG